MNGNVLGTVTKNVSFSRDLKFWNPKDGDGSASPSGPGQLNGTLFWLNFLSSDFHNCSLQNSTNSSNSDVAESHESNSCKKMGFGKIVKNLRKKITISV